MQFEKVTDVIGAEVHDIDLRAPLDDTTVIALDRALAEHGVLFFRDQQLGPAQHRDFGARFGELHLHPYERNLGGDLATVLVLDSENYKEKGRNPVPWHHDATFEKRPPRGSVLRAVQLPDVGGDTVWSSMYAAYDSLSSKLQRFVDELDAVHDATASFGRRVAEGRARDDAQTSMTRNVHPVVAVHPVSGRKALFVNRVFTESIAGMGAAESAHLLELLFRTVHVPDAQVRLRWRPGTVAMWDNRCTQHYAVGGYTGRRVMQRVTFLGPEPER